MLTSMKLFLCVGVVAACTQGEVDITSSVQDVGLRIDATGAGEYVLPTGERLQVQHVGLQVGAAVPPKGVGVAPILGRPGQVPASYPATSIGANGAPGSINLYGGQWVLPLSVSPGAKVGNVSCDFITNSSTVATMELVGRLGTVASKTVGPANNVFTIVWLLPTDTDPNGYTVADGEHITIRLSFRDNATGGWSSGAQQMPVVGCAVNATQPLTLTIPIVPPTSTLSVIRNFASVSGSGAGGSKIVVPVSLPVGRTVVGVRSRVADSSGGFGPSTFAHSFVSQSDGSELFTTIATAQPSAGNGQEQTVAITSLSVPVGPTSEYFVILGNAAGGGTTIVYRLNVDLQ